jgi:hypothetical protein
LRGIGATTQFRIAELAGCTYSVVIAGEANALAER